MVETAFSFAGGMEWNRDQQVEVPSAQPGIAEGFSEPASEGVAQVTMMSVLKFMDQLANQSAAPINRDGRIEMQDAMLAVGARKGLGNCAGKWLGAFRAKRGRNSRSPLPATLAEIFGSFHFT